MIGLVAVQSMVTHKAGLITAGFTLEQQSSLLRVSMRRSEYKKRVEIESLVTYLDLHRAKRTQKVCGVGFGCQRVIIDVLLWKQVDIGPDLLGSPKCINRGLVKPRIILVVVFEYLIRCPASRRLNRRDLLRL
jgi:hypothetical protein